MKPIHVLLVEDNEGDILLTREAFEQGRFKYTLDVVRNGQDALHFLLDEKPYIGRKLPDLVILDINLPKLNGQEVLNAIKKNEHLKMIPVIMFTTSSTDSDVISSYKNYANCYITKPFETHDFQGAIHSIEDFWVNLVNLPRVG
jgi:CheY-like chemotaxis protein